MSTRTPVFKGHSIAALVFICLSVFVISVDATIVNVALPTLSRELDADTAQLQWIVDAYSLVMAGLMLRNKRHAAVLYGHRDTRSRRAACPTASVAAAGSAQASLSSQSRPPLPRK